MSSYKRLGVSTVFQKNKVAIVKVALGEEQDMQIKLAVVLIQASGGWKISKIFYLAESPDFYE
jgi:hypothetical protein